MARRLVWTIRARNDKQSIFSYWNERNQSKAYSRKLNRLFEEVVALMKDYPLVGRKTQFENIFVKVVREYLIVYQVTDKDIIILTIWDGRRNPDTML